MQYEDKLLDHDYDGIQELDNKLPPWWLNLFYITIIWGVGYFFYYHVFDIGNSQVESYREEMGYAVEKSSSFGLKEYKSPFADKAGSAPAQQQPAGSPAPETAAAPAEQEPEKQYELVTDAGRLEHGKQVFMTNCLSCHGANGEGGIGPNLTDPYWINGDGSLNAIVKVVTNGVPVKGMIAWKPILSETDILDVSSHVYNLRGTNPANAKAPQGEKYGE